MHPFDAAFSRLSALTNYERQKPGRRHRFDLTGMAELCEALGHPEERLGKVVQVGGSKGKGTVTSLLAGMGRAAGLRSTAYLSPHVVDVRERVRIDGEMATKDQLAGPIGRVVDAMEREHTWFEAFTVAALLCFAEIDPDLCVLEVGLGGRLDSTTWVPKHACCITGIELEHTHLLGDTLARVATEKAGLLRPSVPCVTAATGKALATIEARCRRLSCPLTVLDADLELEILGRTEGGMDVAIRLPSRPRVVLRIPLQARVHAVSFALALAAFAEVFPDLVPVVLTSDLDDWVPRAMPPARFQVLSREPPVVVDGAHTDGSLLTLASDLGEAFPGRRFRLVFSIASGKRWQRGLGALLPLVDRAWVAPLEGKVGVAPGELQSFLEASGVPCRVVASVAEAVSEARASTGDAGLLVTGSLYVAGDALRVLGPETTTPRRCEDDG